MLYTLFFSRLRDLDPEQALEYATMSAELRELARAQHPGFIDMKSYVADDGERLTVVRFSDEEAQRAWKLEPAHRSAQSEGRTTFYESYRIAVCERLRGHGWPSPEHDAPAS